MNAPRPQQTAHPGRFFPCCVGRRLGQEGFARYAKPSSEPGPDLRFGGARRFCRAGKDEQWRKAPLIQKDAVHGSTHGIVAQCAVGSDAIGTEHDYRIGRLEPRPVSHGVTQEIGQGREGRGHEERQDEQPHET